MDFGVTGLAFLAGLLTVLSPCVLPLLPIVFGSAASAHRLGPVALTAGVAISFVAIGLFIATMGCGRQQKTFLKLCNLVGEFRWAPTPHN